MSETSRLLETLLRVSEKSANIARACRQNSHIFELLVQEKFGGDKNARFFRDFKTLADVLIQETIRHDIGIEFPDLAKRARGEESNTFTNTLGESVKVEVCATFDETAKLLEVVLNNDSETASLLATEVHRDIQLAEVPVDGNLPRDLDILVDDLGIWIDPIDSTADYINGIETIDEVTGVHLSGLRCVTVLIGVYRRSTGLPVLGVVNQPFFINSDSAWTGVCHWGFANDQIQMSSIIKTDRKNNVICLSRFENPEVKAKLSEDGITLMEVSGAGYKMLTVALGQVDAYILSKSSTFRWDTCAPQAILFALGGGVIDYKKFVKYGDSTVCYLTYNSSADENQSNQGGLIAYRDEKVLESLRTILTLQ